MTTITKATSRGQITLPKVWRDKFKTDQYVIKQIGQRLFIIPMDKKALNDFTKTQEKILEES